MAYPDPDIDHPATISERQDEEPTVDSAR